MGRKHRRSGITGFVHPAGIVLITLLVWGCSARNIFQPAPNTDQKAVHQLVTRYDQQIRKKEFQQAAQTCSRIIKLIQKSQAGDQEHQLRLLRSGQTLIGEIMAEQEKNSRLKSRANQTENQQNQLTAANKDLEAQIKGLKQAVQDLEQEKAGLAKQLEQMKQIDLK